MNVKFHKNCENTGKILKISCVRCHFVKFDIYFDIYFRITTLIQTFKVLNFSFIVFGLTLNTSN